MSTPNTNNIKYLRAELIGGLCNKLFCLISAIDICLLEGYTLIEPDFGWKRPVKMGGIWNLDKLIAGVSGLQIISQGELSIQPDTVIINKAGTELWKYSETILAKQRTECKLSRVGDTCCRVLTCLEPSCELLERIAGITSGISECCAVHFRTETDWLEYSKRKQRRMPAGERIWTSNADIAGMVTREFGQKGYTLFFTCGENRSEITGLLGDKRALCFYDDDLEYEQNGALNWYICSMAGCGFVGLSRSTFSNLICLKRELTGLGGACWIYNWGDSGLVRRVDMGLHPAGEDAVKKVTVMLD
jgi:hypothetical protein